MMNNTKKQLTLTFKSSVTQILSSKRFLHIFVFLSKQGCVSYVSELTHPIVACLAESEARVRYSAAEALYNVLKIVRGAALPYFTLIFDALARLAADPEPQVKQGAELLDRLVKVTKLFLNSYCNLDCISYSIYSLKLFPTLKLTYAYVCDV